MIRTILTLLFIALLVWGFIFDNETTMETIKSGINAVKGIISLGTQAYEELNTSDANNGETGNGTG